MSESKPFGRPSTYTDDMLQKAQEYVDGGYKDLGHAVPSIIGLTKALNRSKTTIYRWIEEPGKEDFRDIAESLMDSQYLGLTNGSLKGDLNPNISKLMLTKHGLSDRSEVSGPDGKPIEIDTEFRITVVEPNA